MVCHGAPGVDPGEIGQGLNPGAPDLTLPRTQARSDGELYWIVSEGIRMTGMPAFGSTYRDEQIADLVAFVRSLPKLSPAEQQEVRAAWQATQPAR